MKFTYLTIFPQVIENYLSYSIPKRAKEAGLAEYEMISLRDFSDDNYKTIDDRPYGGGAGMVMMLEPVYKALKHVLGEDFDKLLKKELDDTAVVLLSAKGDTWNQGKAKETSAFKHVIFIVPHFEGIDERVTKHLVTHEVSIGDYVLTGGELPSLVITDSIVRLLPGVLGNEVSIEDESFSDNLLEYPQFTRPMEFGHNNEIWKVPDVLISGDHAKIKEWRKKMSEETTKEKRPDLFEDKK